MNKATFNQLIKGPSAVKPDHKAQLAQLIVSFPYASNIKLLHLSALLYDSDIHFERELKKTTCYITDRRVLRKIVQQPTHKSAYLIDEGIGSLKVVSKETLSDNQPIVSEVSKEDIPIETDREAEDKDLKIEGENKKTPTLIPELNEQITASAVNASISMEAGEIEISKEPVKKVNIEVSEKISVDKKSFLDWIGAKNDIPTQKEPICDHKIEERIEFRKKAEDLINQFIIDQPRIDIKKEFFSPGNMAKKSLEDHDTIVTETLAKMYATQGNISKAISTYKQLILRFPEKKSYFASLIEDLKSI